MQNPLGRNLRVQRLSCRDANSRNVTMMTRTMADGHDDEYDGAGDDEGGDNKSMMALATMRVVITIPTMDGDDNG